MIFPNFSSGYSSFDPIEDVPDLSGKVVLITGANTGIGLTSARHMANRGAKVYLGARNESRGRRAAESLAAELRGNGSVQWLHADLSTPTRAKAAAQEFLKVESRLHILVHNAGVGVQPYQTVSEGGLVIEATMATNHLGPFVLTQYLLPILEQTAKLANSDVRIVCVSSENHRMAPSDVNFRGLDGWNRRPSSLLQEGHRYNMSKLANILFIKHLQARFTAEGIPITCLAIHPGTVKTDLHKVFASHYGLLGSLLSYIVSWIGLSPEKGGYTTLFAATSPLVKQSPEIYKGSYIIPFNRVREPYLLREGLAGDLWACSEEVMEICLRSKSG